MNFMIKHCRTTVTFSRKLILDWNFPEFLWRCLQFNVTHIFDFREFGNIKKSQTSKHANINVILNPFSRARNLNLFRFFEIDTN